MVTGKLRSRSLVLLCLSAAFPLISWQGQATASESTSSPATAPKEILPSAPRSLETNFPQLPPLGEPNKYLPLEENVSEDRQLVTRLVIKLSERRVYVYQGEQVITSFPIAIGKAGWETPTGNFQVIQKYRDPAWEHPWTGEVVPPEPDNPLGDRWIGFWTDGENYIGFHGTPKEELVGQAVSHGCIRMRNNDVRALFERVAVGTPVVVKP